MRLRITAATFLKAALHRWRRLGAVIIITAAATTGLVAAASIPATGNAAATASRVAAANAPAKEKPKPQPFYICGGEGYLLCLSNSKTKNPHGAKVEICDYNNTPCQLANHIWVVPKGHIGIDHYQPLRWHGDRLFFHGYEVVQLYWMHYTGKGPHAKFGPTTYCMVPTLVQNGAHVVLESCKKIGNKNRALWILFPLTKVGYITQGLVGIANVYECNKQDKNGEIPTVMTSTFRDEPDLRDIHMIPLHHDDDRKLFFQAWEYAKAPVK